MTDDIPIFSLVKKGTKDFPRFVLSKADEYRNPTYWNDVIGRVKTSHGWARQNQQVNGRSVRGWRAGLLTTFPGFARGFKGFSVEFSGRDPVGAFGGF